MVQLSYAKNLSSLLSRSTKTLLIIGRADRLGAKSLPSGLAEDHRRLVSALAEATKPGDQGATQSSLTLSSPARLVVGVLPEKVSRYNSTAHPSAVHKIVVGAGMDQDQQVAILLLLSDQEALLPTLNAVGRAFPLLSLKSAKSQTRVRILALGPNGKPLGVPPWIQRTVEAARSMAEMVDTPPSQLNPRRLEAMARRVLAGHRGVRIKVLSGQALLREGLGGIAAVGQAAQEGPRLLIARYSPARPARNKKHVALVGKGITFDTGGLHLKPRGSMETMKSDMGGAAAVLGAFSVLVAERPRHELSLLLCLAENAIDARSYKPDDVLTLHSGKTVEINNTDAEGRLLLADGVSYAARKLKAKVVLDAATLTGAQLIATGVNHAAVVSNDEALEQLMVASGKSTGDLAHPLPFAPELYKAEFKSPIADMRNSVKNRMNAQSSCAAQFVFNHIEDCDVRWGHVDLAGPAFRDDRATGFGVALIAETVRRL